MTSNRARIGMGAGGIGVLGLIALLSSQSPTSNIPGLEGVVQLSSCAIENSTFKPDDFDSWRKEYHETVSKVIQADVDALSKPQCAEGDDVFVAPTQELKDLAQKLPPWKDQKKFAALSQADMGTVLLEYLRTYECTMLEYRTFLPNKIVEEGGMDRGKYDELYRERSKILGEELNLSRLTLQRTLAITGRMNRLRPLFSDINCLTAASLDVRNVMGLIGSAMACLPKIRNADVSLFDLPKELPK